MREDEEEMQEDERKGMEGEYDEYLALVEIHVRPREIAALVLGFCGSRLRDLRCDRCGSAILPREVLEVTRNGGYHETISCHDGGELKCSNLECLCYFMACERCSCYPFERLWRKNPAWRSRDYYAFDSVLPGDYLLQGDNRKRTQQHYDLYPIDGLFAVPDAFPVCLRKFAGVNLESCPEGHDSENLCNFCPWRPARDKLGCLKDEPPDEGIEGSNGNGTHHWACGWCQDVVHFTSK